MPNVPGRILVTGANGHLGRQLIERLGRDSGRGIEIRAAVRSQRAAAQVEAIQVAGAQADTAASVEITQVDYTSAASLRDAAQGCDAVVHFVGIIKETREASYADAHERTCEALVEALSETSVERVVYLSILHSGSDSNNACLRSKGRAEQILLDSETPSLVLRVPMVLGPSDHASSSLRGQARARFLPLFGGGTSKQQPIDSADVVEAIVAALRLPKALRGALDLGGPECLSHKALVARAAALYQVQATTIGIPLGLMRAGIGLLERVQSSPPMTLAMFDVLQQDDEVDPHPACRALGIELTPLDTTLRRYVGPESIA